MIAAFGTIAFVGTLWLVVVVGAAVLEKSGAKIAAALNGGPPPEPLGTFAASRRDTVRCRRDCPSLVSGEPRWRAAA